MTHLVITLLRLALVVLGLFAVLAQCLIPVVAAQVAKEYPEVAHLAVPYSVAAIAAILCVEVVVVIVWRLLSRISADEIFAERALRQVDAIIWTMCVAAVLSAGVTVHLIGVEQTGGPGVALMLMVTVVAAVVMTLLMLVMRGLLRMAITNRGELNEVI